MDYMECLDSIDNYRNEDNIKRGHVYLIDIVSEEQKKRIYNEYEKVKDIRHYSELGSVKINFKQFKPIMKKQVRKILTHYGFKIKNDIAYNSGLVFGTRYLNLNPIRKGLYINEIFFLKFLDGKPLDFNFSAYWIFNYCILDKELILKKLIKKKYLNIGYSIYRYLKLNKNTELKEILKKNNIKFKSNTNKDELINLIINNNIINESEVVPTYYITEEGKNIIKECEVYFINKKIEYPILETDLYINNDMYYWLYKYKEEYIEKEIWGYLRNIYFAFSRLKDENEKIFLFNSFIIDTSGLENSSYCTPGQIVIYNMYKNEFHDVEKLLDYSIYDELPFHYLTKEEIVQIVEKINEIPKIKKTTT